MRLAVGTGLRSPCRASCGRSSPLVCTRMPPGRLIIAWRAKKRAEWLALSGLLYLTNSANSRVRSTHLLHRKSPFSRFFGCRRQKSENIVASARGRRTPQAPTLRIWGCANARKYDYKSSSLYSRSRRTDSDSAVVDANDSDFNSDDDVPMGPWGLWPQPALGTTVVRARFVLCYSPPHTSYERP